MSSKLYVSQGRLSERRVEDWFASTLPNENRLVYRQHFVADFVRIDDLVALWIQPCDSSRGHTYI